MFKSKSLLSHEEIVRRYNNGENTVQIGVAAKLSSQSIRKILIKNNIAIRTVADVGLLNRKFNYKTIIEQYLSGKSLNWLALTHGTDASCILQILKKSKCKLRSHSESVLSKDKHPMWKGGRTISSDGYESVKEGKVHRIKMSELINRKLEPWECVHHVDGNKKNNDQSNLVIMPIREHTRFHNFISNRGIGPSRSILDEICRVDQENYYRFTRSDAQKAAINRTNTIKRTSNKFRKCCVKDCGNKSYGHGLCSKHYQRKKANDRGGWRSGKGRTANVRKSWDKENFSNGRVIIKVEYAGKIQCLKAWAIELGFNYYTIYMRYKNGDRGDYLFRKFNERFNNDS